jgi:hypothetical protein
MSSLTSAMTDNEGYHNRSMHNDPAYIRWDDNHSPPEIHA